MVNFISYTGKYPTLCMGVLTLEIDGDIITFGNRYNNDNIDYGTFWESGGGCGFDEDWEDYVYSGEWIINEFELPEQYRKYTDEITKLFNANVPCGCCGGCI